MEPEGQEGSQPFEVSRPADGESPARPRPRLPHAAPTPELSRGGAVFEPLLVGRTHAQSALLTLLESVSGGMSSVIVVRGEAGVGKTALLRYVTNAAPASVTVRQLAGLESETHLGFAAIHRLVAPYIGQIEALPDVQAQSLRTALGLAAGPPPSAFLLGLAVLSLLAEVTEAGPLVVIIDDAQWLDAESLHILGFVARRVFAEPLGLFFGVREPLAEPVLEGIPVIEVGGLITEDATDLVLALTEGRVDREVARRIAVKSTGNPLVITEACRDLTFGPTQNGLLLDDPLPMGQRLESHFHRQMRALPDDCQALLLYASAVPDLEPDLMRAASVKDGLNLAAMEAAVTAGLIELRPRLHFRHPLIRSAIYSGATDASRRHIHEVLAGIVDPEADSDLRAWHLAAAAAGPDEIVAAELERSATSARARGGFLAEAAYLARAAELSPDAWARADRQISAAEAALTGGAPARAQDLLDAVLQGIKEPELLARARKLQANALLRAGGAGERNPATLVDAAHVFFSTRPDLARETMLEALEQTFVRAHLIAGISPREVGEAALAMSGSGGPPVVELLLSSVGTHLSRGYVAAAPLMREALSALGKDDALGDEVPRWFSLGLFVAQLMWDERAAKAWLTRCDRVARQTGAIDLAIMTLMPLSGVHATLGELTSAETRLADFRALSHVAGQPDGHIARIQNPRLLALRGRDEEARAAAVSVFEAGARIGSGNHRRLGNLALLQVAMGRGLYPEAFSYATTIAVEDNVGMKSESLPALIEAGVRSGHREEADHALDRLRELANASGTPWALGLLFRCEALLATDDDADPLYQRAVSEIQQTEARLDLARTRLLYGEWLRRQRRRSDAREQLRLSHQLFDDMGAWALADRAWIELQATGEHNTPSGTILTAQESQIARLASDGATNQEIATQLFISNHTVEYHLRKVFRKLDITSRRKLPTVL
jgi:DNA-binding CsgD family transcriptional regulator